MSLWRYSWFMAKGLSEFSKSGYDKAAKSFDPKALDVDLKDRSVVVTGANQGLGKVVALEFARRGGAVHMLCRNEDRAKQAQAEIIQATKNDRVFIHIVDMSRPNQIRSFVDQFKKEGYSVNVLVNNAGCMLNERQETPEGFEANFATNTFGVYLLTTLLLDDLKKADRPRVITVTSGGMLLHRLDISDLQCKKHFDGTNAYAQHKRQEVEMTDYWASKYPNILFVTTHPGWAETENVRTSMPGFFSTFKNSFRTVEEGADSMVYLAVANDIEKRIPNGSFVQDRAVVSKHLPLAWTTAAPGDVQKFFDQLQAYDTAIQQTGHI